MAEGVPAPHLFRRLFHLASPVFLVYYWIPVDLGNPATGLTRQALLMLAAGTVLAVDLGRLALRIPVFGLRKYEAGRVSATRFLAREGKLYIRVFPHKSVTSTPEETRMGKGKGEVEYWCAVVKPGTILFEIGGVPETLARQAFFRVSHKLPFKTRMVPRRPRY